jgi:predicted dehydrogenase
MDRLRVGFIGAGRISDLHALGYLDDPRTSIVAVCDADLDLARQRGQRWGVRPEHVFADYHDLLALPEVDLVEILLPHHLHCQATLDAAAAGKHISLQKPMALTVAEADGMVAAAQAAGVIFKVFENFIFYPPVQRAKALIEAGEIGEPLTIRIKSNAAISPNEWKVPRAAQVWRFTPDQCGGGPLVFDDGHHKFSLAWYFMGLAEEVHAWIGQTEVEPGAMLDSPAIVSWKFPGNRFGSLETVLKAKADGKRVV